MDVLSAIGRRESQQNVFGEHFGTVQQNERHIYFDLPVSLWDLVYFHICMKDLLYSVV